jgi:hypothetical protein
MTAAVSIASLKHIEKQLALHKVESLDMLPKEVRKQIKRDAKQIALTDVFGVGHSTDKTGAPIEMGVGAKGNMTQQCIDAYIKAQTDSKTGPEPGYEDHLKRMRQDFAACEARRAATRTAADDDDED